jgi:hypothetical protein
MARKKKQPTDPPPENLDNDDTFGLPEVEYQPLKREEPEKTEEPVSQDEPIEPPVEREAPEVVVVNETQQDVPEPEPAPAQDRSFEFKDSVHEDSNKEDRFEQPERYQDVHQPYTPTYNYKDDNAQVWPKVIVIFLVLALIGIGIWYFAIYRPNQLAKEEQDRKELLAIQEEARKKEADRQAAKQKEDEQKAAAALPPPAPAVGTIETLSGRSGRYYVVIASSIDGDLIMDYAKKLSGNGVSTKIIPPFGKSSFHRLAVADGDTYQMTQARADELKGGDYGDKLWVVKY